MSKILSEACLQKRKLQKVQFESGNIFIPENAKYTGDYVEELVSFPNAKHDDQVDATSQAINYMERKRPAQIITTNAW